MMDPDFAGKLSADVAADEETSGDTDFTFGAAEPSAEEKTQAVEELEAATSFDFGGNADQMPLLDASHFSPFAEGAQTSLPQDAQAKAGERRSSAPGPCVGTWE